MLEDAEWHVERRWAYYDKKTFRIYKQVKDGNDLGAVTLVDEGTHGLAKLNRVPLFGLRIP